MYRSLRPIRFSTLSRHLLVALAGFACTLPAMADVTIPDTPVQLGSTIPPNIMVSFDDSGSMYWRYIYIHDASGNFPKISGSGITSTATGDETSNDNFSNCNYCVVTGDTTSSGGYNQSKYMVDKTAALNGMYYDPAINYITRWRYPNGGALSGSDSATYENACNDHNDVDYNYSGGGLAISTTCSNHVDLSKYVNTYYVPINASGNLSDPTNYYRYQIIGDETTGQVYRSTLDKSAPESATTGCDGGSATTYQWRHCTAATPITAANPSGRSAAAEIKNFGNWYSYYQTRIKTAKAGLTTAFSSLSNVRVGFFPLNTGSNGLATTLNIPVNTDQGLFEDKASPAVTNKSNWFNIIVGTEANSGTALRNLLKKTGDYYSKTDPNGPYGPKDDAGDLLSCRQNFTILTTDGYWNGGSPGVGNADGSAGYPFADTDSDTLADVAYKYWSTDLNASLDNNVPTTPGKDNANWQHMATFTISIGAQGTLDPVTILADIAANTPFTWPTPVSNKVSTIDDLFHAAVNGHGSFVVASNPTDFVTALTSALDSIKVRQSSGSNVAVNANQLSTPAELFQTTFTNGQWTGDLLAYPISTAGVVGSTATWLASQHLLSFADRKNHVFTWDTAATDGATFPTAQQSTDLGDSAPSTPISDYILGNQAKEQKNGGPYRDRVSVLGDMIDSSPVYVAGDGTASNPNMVYVGGNDGMLHAFNDSDNGSEVFDYVPGGLDMSVLKTLATVKYTHKYFVDGALTVATKAQTKNATDPTGKNILVGVLGRGGKTVYGLDVSDPTHFKASDVLWEYTAPGMGNSLGAPIIAKLNKLDVNGNNIIGVIIGNGYNSTNGHSEIFILNVRTGKLVKELDTGVGNTSTQSNGMSTPKGWDEDRDGAVDELYAGDLLGNVWEFDVSDSSTANWTSTYTAGAAGIPMYTAKDAGGNPQPITGGFAIGLNPADFSRWVFFGTGRYITAEDPADKSVQTWYGIQDNGPNPDGSSQVSSRSDLKQRTIVAYATVGGIPFRAFGEAVAGDMLNEKGWYLDLEDYSHTPAVAQGERIVSDTVLLGNVLLSASIIPATDDPCSAVGSGFINAISPFTGGALSDPFFDSNGNGTVDNSDVITSGGHSYVPGSINLGVGMPSLPSFVQKVLSGTGSLGNIGQVIVSTPTNSGRVSWREVILGN